MGEILTREQLNAAKSFIQENQAKLTAAQIHRQLEEKFGITLPFCIIVSALIDLAVTQDDIDREQANEDFLATEQRNEKEKAV